MALESVILTCTINAHDGWDTSITKISRVFLCTKIYDQVQILLRIQLTELVYLIYLVLLHKYVIDNMNGKPVFYVILQNVVY